MATTILDTFLTVFEYKVEGLEKVEKVNKKLNAMGKTLTRKLTAPIIAGFGGMLFAASKFEDGLDNVLNLLDADSVDMYKDALEELQKQAVRNGFALRDVNQGLFDNVSALGKGAKALDNFEVSQKLAIAGNAELGVAIDGQTSVINAYGKEVTDATDVANAFFTAQKAGKTTVSALASNVGKVAPLAKQAGIGFEVLLASMSQLTLGGLSTEESATALRGAIAGLLKPTEEAKDLLEEYSIPVGAAALQSANFTDVLLKLAKAAQENPDALAEMIPNIRALTAVSALGEDEVDNLNKTIAQMGEQTAEASFMLDGYNRRSKNAANRTKQMWGELQVAAKELGENLLPYLTKTVKTLSKFFNWVSNLSPALQKVVLGFAAFLAILGPLIVGVTTVINLFLTLSSLYALLEAGQIGLNIAMLANPVGIIIALVIALVAWFATAYIKMGSLSGAFKLMGSQLVAFGQRILKYGMMPINLLVRGVTKLIALMGKIPGLGKLKDAAKAIEEAQDTFNRTATGSASFNPFAARETAAPFSPLTPTTVIPQTSSGGSRSVVDNRSTVLSPVFTINEATDGQAVASTINNVMVEMARSTSQDFQSPEAE